jgi:hypothetical protein
MEIDAVAAGLGAPAILSTDTLQRSFDSPGFRLNNSVMMAANNAESRPTVESEVLVA